MNITILNILILVVSIYHMAQNACNQVLRIYVKTGLAMVESFQLLKNYQPKTCAKTGEKLPKKQMRRAPAVFTFMSWYFTLQLYFNFDLVDCER